MYAMQDKCGFRAGDGNLRRYVGNNPTNATDPSGLIEWEVNQDEDAIIVMKTSVRFVWKDAQGSEWTEERKNDFRRNFKKTVEDTWNAAPFVIRAARVARGIPGVQPNEPYKAGILKNVIARDWIPLLEVTEAENADWKVEVLANPSPGSAPFLAASSVGLLSASSGPSPLLASSLLVSGIAHEDAAPPIIQSSVSVARKGPNKGDRWAELDEGDVFKKETVVEGVPYVQLSAAHEFGHLLGLEHPGKKFAKDEYTKDAASLMGHGMEMRAEYYEQWRRWLEDHYFLYGPFIIVRNPRKR